MIKKSAEIDIKSNAGGSIAELKALKRELKNVAAGSAEFKELYNEIDDLEDKIKSAKNSSSDWVDSLQNAGGPLGALGAGINRAKVATQSFGGALKATGIGLVVALVAGLVAAFQGNENAMKKLQPLLTGIQKIFQGVFRAVEPLFNTLVDLAISALPAVSKAFEVVYSSISSVFQSLGILGKAIKKLISGDFSGAWETAKTSVTSFSKNYDKSVESFQRGTKEMTKTEKEESDKRGEIRKVAGEKARAEQQKNDEAFKSLYEKQINEIENLLDDSEEKKLTRAKERELEEINNLKGINDIKRQILIDDLEQKYLLIAEQNQRILDMQSAKNAVVIIDNLEKALETPAQKENREYLEKKAVLDANNLSTELLTQQHLTNLNKIEQDAGIVAKTNSDKVVSDKKAEADKLIAIEIAVKENKAAVADAIYNIAAGLNNLLQQAGVKNKAILKAALLAEKAAAIGSIVMNTMVANAKAAAAFPLTLGQPWVALNFVSMGIGIATTIASTVKALGELGGGGAGGAGSIPTGAGGAGGVSLPTAPNVQFQNTPQSQISDTIKTSSQERSQEPVRAYVVSNDITTAQELTRNTIESSKF